MEWNFPQPTNEPVLAHAPGSPERLALEKALHEAYSRQVEVRSYIGGRFWDGEPFPLTPPHRKSHLLGTAYRVGREAVEAAIEAALRAHKEWSRWSFERRAEIFLKAADLLSQKYRAYANAACMIGQSKTVFQSEIDIIAELADFWRFNVHYAEYLLRWQPYSPPLTRNRMDYRPLEGFVVAITPFNFASIAGNLPTAPALMGNVVLWKPAETQLYSARVILEVLLEAGLPEGVINMLVVSGPTFSEVALRHPSFAGLHFTGSTATLNLLWQTISQNLSVYRNYPRVVAETGGKDFVWVHPSADAQGVAVALARGAYEYQGQKCSAASRAYLPASRAEEILGRLIEMMRSFRMGPPEDFSNFITAVIDKKAFDKIVSYIELGKADPAVSLLEGGGYDDSVGYFIQPTLFQTTAPKHRLMEEEIFGPVLTVYVYPDEKWEESLHLLDETSPYGLTGAIWAQDRRVIDKALDVLRYSAGNIYVNDKPTGAVVNQQPFGGARASGTNDKAGSPWNLIRWVSPRAIKENFLPPQDYRYPFMG
ncbi:MAG: L-glutamate gamma-semialdehyde dehydrogenase [Bacteroidia bacterium]|nr:L-glutamate gamma-semialdehyde dehydrogenase [Bacteroidia bacterium]MCX7764396.1 L-glutamate gamma-semialdehyde dehydrogenase [Bacteroidia bacterium]MDW8056683.1 L-glutamate gamma-semialdehyde dehydrogenase [Bacteroidia bacterium]